MPKHIATTYLDLAYLAEGFANIRDNEDQACIAIVEKARPSGKFRPDHYDDGRNDACNDISKAIRARIKARQA